MDIDRLMSKSGMRDYTNEQRDTLANDAAQVRQLAQIVRARLDQTDIEGDGARSAARRARKVAGRFEKVAKCLEQAAAECEGANASYVRDVLELPARRQKVRERKELRQHRRALAKGGLQDMVTKTLTASTNGLNTTTMPTNTQITPPVPAHAPQYVNPQPFPMTYAGGGPATPLGDVADFFPEAL